MSLLQVVTDAIANPQQVRLSQERASARTFSGLEPKMKAVRDISPESMQGVSGVAIHRTTSCSTSRPSSQASSRALSRASSRVRSALPTSLIRPIAQLQRSQSDVPLKSPVLLPKQEFTPCITAVDLTNDQIKRNYSSDDLSRWNKSKNPLPPIPLMRGYGRYRTAVAADPEWHMEYLRKQVKGIECLDNLTAGLDMQDIAGVTPEQWQTLTSSNIRRASTISSQSTGTDSSAGYREFGTRITRGFSPSGSSTKSSQNGFIQGHKSSTLSMVNLPSDADSLALVTPPKRTSTLLSERRSSGPLSTIEELQTNTTLFAEIKRKVEKPCEFSDSGDPDSAVASDVEEDGWTDVAETNPPKVSAITQMLKEGKPSDAQLQQTLGLTRVRTTSSDKRRSKSSAVNLDRSKTIRGTRPEVKRRQSKTKKMHERGSSDEKGGCTNSGGDTADSGDKSSAGLEMHITNPIREHIKLRPTDDLTGCGLTDAGTGFVSINKSSEQWYPARNRSTTAIFTANPT